jgi:Domain of unknown function (DUF4185)
MNPLVMGGSLIQSDFGGPGAHNLEAVVARPRADGPFDLQHYWRLTTRPDRTWHLGATITAAARGPATICQRPSPGGHGNFEVVVPVDGGLAHFWLDNTLSGPRPWNRVHGFAAAGADGPGAILANRSNDNLELMALHGRNLVHHWFDRTAWRTGATISTNATGAPAFIQSDFDDHLEVLVPEGDDLVLYFLDGFTWRPGGLATLSGDGPIGLVQGRYGSDPHRNFELVVPRGDSLFLYWRDNARTPDLPWRPGGVATWGAGPVRASALCSTDHGDRWLHALTQEDTSIYHLYRHRTPGDGFRWMRSACLRLDDRARCDVDPGRPRSEKIAQVTGEPDAQTGRNTLGMTRSKSGIHGTDLGVTFSHRGRRFLLFGDTHWDDGSRVTLDSIGEVHDRPAGQPPVVDLHGSPLRVVGGAITDREYDVPLDAFSAAGQVFVFFTSDRFENGKVMSRSVLTRALDPGLQIDPRARDRTLDHQLLTTFSDHRFINVSVQFRPAAAVPGFGGRGDVLLIWGSGAYRADDLRLAVLDLRDPALWPLLLGREPSPVGLLGVRYFTGACAGMPSWSLYEDEARPLLWPGALGELSVRWVPEIVRYLLMAMSGPEDPIGAAVWLRTARQPWGPWSARRQVFDWVLDGMGLRDRNGDGRPDRVGQFIHDAGASPPDQVGDCIFDIQCNGGGAAYAPYLHEVRRQGERVTLRYMLSTWNPYQVMLMSHDVTMRELEALEA